MKKTLLTAGMVLVVAVAAASADSTTLLGGTSHDLVLTGGGNSGTVGNYTLLTSPDESLSGVLNYYEVYDANFHVSGHRVDLHDAGGAFLRTVAEDTESGFGSFVTVAGPDVYLGRADWQDPSTDVIARVVGGLSAVGGAVETVMPLVSSYAMAVVSPDVAYAVYKDGTNKIARLDLAARTAEAVVDVGGFSAGLDCDGDGNLYFGTYASGAVGGGEAILKLTAAQLAGGVALMPADAEIVVELPSGQGAAGVAVDAAGNVVFAMNGGRSELAVVYAGKDYTGAAEGFDVLAGGKTWLSHVEAVGDVRLYDTAWPNNAAMVNGFYQPISYVPEPTTMGLLALAAAAGLRRRRGRHSRGRARGRV
jgi:hypothetical protein